MDLNSLKSLNTSITSEVVTKMVAVVFMDLKGAIPAPDIVKIREYVSTIANKPREAGSSFDMLINQIAAYWDKDRTPAANVDAALEENPHLRFQLIEIAKAISPLVLQTIRWLEVYQNEASDKLFELQEAITSKLSTDEINKSYEIVDLDLGALNDPDTLDAVAVVADEKIPSTERLYSNQDYKIFANRHNPYRSLDADARGKLAEFLLDEGFTDSAFRNNIIYDPSDSLMTSDLSDPKTTADLLTDRWEKANYIKRAIAKLPNDNALKVNGVAANVDGLIARLALAIKSTSAALEAYCGKYGIAYSDNKNIYLYPWAREKLAKLTNESPEYVDTLIENFVRAANATNTKPSTTGWTITEIASSKDRSIVALENYRQNMLRAQALDTKNVIRSVCRDNLKDFPMPWVNKITKDLESSSASTLQDILNAYIERVGDFYVTTMFDASKNLDLISENDTDAKSSVLLKFVIDVIANKVI